MASANRKRLTYAEEFGIAVYYVCRVPLAAIEHEFGVSRMTISRVLKRLGVEADRSARASK